MQRSSRRVIHLLLVGSIFTGLGLGRVLVAQDRQPSLRSTPAFDQLKALAGEWEGKNAEGMPGKVTYQVVSNGSAVMERLMPQKESEMVTMYTLEGDRIVVTHYCSAGNQPTMISAPLSAATGKIDFTFARLGGAKSPDEGHMQSLSLNILDKNHLTQIWIFTDHGKSIVQNFNFVRKT